LIHEYRSKTPQEVASEGEEADEEEESENESLISIESLKKEKENQSIHVISSGCCGEIMCHCEDRDLSTHL
jgi:hypothetical protein